MKGIAKLITAGALICGVAGTASATIIGHLNSGSQANAGTNLSHIATNNLITPSELDSYLALSNAAYNAMTPAALAAAYDVLVMPWYVDTDANFDWATRLLPYLSAGGSILWENPFDLAELAGSGVGLSTGNVYGGGPLPVGAPGTITLAAPFGDLGAEGYYHIHFSITGKDGTWNCWSVDVNGRCHGVNKEFAGGGRMVIGVSDNLYHPDFTRVLDADHRQLTINQLNWLVTGDIRGTCGLPGLPPCDGPIAVPEPATLSLLGLGLVGVALIRRRRQML